MLSGSTGSPNCMIVPTNNFLNRQGWLFELLFKDFLEPGATCIGNPEFPFATAGAVARGQFFSFSHFWHRGTPQFSAGVAKSTHFSLKNRQKCDISPLNKTLVTAPLSPPPPVAIDSVLARHLRSFLTSLPSLKGQRTYVGFELFERWPCWLRSEISENKEVDSSL